jgi:phosphatidate cytidylyltransferase
MKRILTAIVGLPIVIFTVWSPIPYFFVVLTSIVALLAVREFYSLGKELEFRPFVAPGYAGTLAVIACFVLQRPELIALVLAAAGITALAAALARPAQLNKALASVSATVFGIVYVGLLAGYLIGVRMLPDSPSAPHLAAKLITFFLAMVMLTDTGAYYTGRALGRTKLAPRISPGKTVEGAVGGFLLALIAGPVCRWTFFPEISIIQAVTLAALISLIGQIGDLAESMLKRGSGVKDSSNLLPGHGGMLDRIDSILFAAPIIYYFAHLVVSR